jgi:hypothetical protein
MLDSPQTYDPCHTNCCPLECERYSEQIPRYLPYEPLRQSSDLLPETLVYPCSFCYNVASTLTAYLHCDAVIHQYTDEYHTGIHYVPDNGVPPLASLGSKTIQQTEKWD